MAAVALRWLARKERIGLAPTFPTTTLGRPWSDALGHSTSFSFMPLLDRCSSAKREAEGFSAAIQELDLKTAVVDRSGLTD
jgi:hypothetical protein